jgi:hypothetical protein
MFTLAQTADDLEIGKVGTRLLAALAPLGEPELA